MPSFSVNVTLSKSEIFEEIDDSELIEEIIRREIITKPMSSDGEKRELLMDAALELRRAGKNGLAFGLDDLLKELEL